MRCAVIGLGEAGRVYAAALAAGHEVLGYDPGDTPTPEGVTRATTPKEAVGQAAYVLVLTAAAAARSVAGDCLLLARLVRPLGGSREVPVEVLDGPPGAAMARKLLRSVFMKGLAAVVCEAVEAGRAAGDEDWIRAEFAGQLAGDGQALIDRFLAGTRTHAVRRAMEMRDTGAYLDLLGVPTEMTRAAEQTLRRLATER
ncbi:DUF1932 domain-containing protein [Nonomuraea sp. RK-328]|nr:DUF1932 domain-containing protein [Nonomuraea sp. RK-328]